MCTFSQFIFVTLLNNGSFLDVRLMLLCSMKRFLSVVFLCSQVEISHLKARQNGLQEEVQKLQQSAQSASSGAALLPVTTSAASTTSSSVSSYLSRPSGTHQGFHGDEMDLSDVLWSQQEINRLSTEVMRLEAEVAHWRRMSQVTMNEELKICCFSNSVQHLNIRKHRHRIILLYL